MQTHDKRLRHGWGAFALGGMVLAACAAEAPPLTAPVASPLVQRPPVPTTLAEITASALDDAVRTTGLMPAELRVLSAEPVTWGDGSLGCPEEGMMYTQALVPGYRVRVVAKERVLDYHASRDGRFLLCPEWRAVPPVSDTDT
jgi:hypothetical protein